MPYSSHDLEAFIYDLIEEQLNQKNDLSASELLDGFYAYLPNQKKFAPLKARLLKGNI
jgi:hypothetical protein